MAIQWFMNRPPRARALVGVAAFTSLVAFGGPAYHRIAGGGTTNPPPQSTNCFLRQSLTVAPTSQTQRGTPLKVTRGGGYSANQESRIYQFMAAVDPAENTGRARERQASGLALLSGGETAFLDCWPEFRPDHAAALKAEAWLPGSDARLARLRETHAAAIAAPAVTATLALAEAMTEIEDPDRSRTLDAAGQAALQQGDKALAEMLASNKRMLDLDLAIRQEAAGDERPLAEASTALIPFDLERLDTAQTEARARGLTAAARHARSKARISDILAALDAVEPGGNAAAQIRLTDAYLELEPGDEAFADTAARARLAKARGRVAQHAELTLGDLVAKADPATAPAGVCERIDRLAMLIEETDGTIEDAVTQGVETCRTRLSSSDARLAALLNAVKLWRDAPSDRWAMLSETVESALAVEEIDRERMELVHEQAFNSLERAAAIVAATKRRLWSWDNSGILPLRVTLAPTLVDDAAGPAILHALTEGLRDAGFAVSSPNEPSAILITIETIDVRPTPGVQETQVSSSVRIDWSDGVAIANDYPAFGLVYERGARAIRKAAATAGTQLAENLKKELQGRSK